MQRLKWNKLGSKQAVITMAYARYMCSSNKITVDNAVKITLATGRHCENHEAISETTFKQLCTAVTNLINRKGRMTS